MNVILHDCTDFDVIEVYRKASDLKTYWRLQCKVCGAVREEVVNTEGDEA